MPDNRLERTTPRLLLKGRFALIERWASGQLTKNPSASVYSGLPRLTGLRYQSQSTASPLGGRIDPHLRHVEEGEAFVRVARADRFISETDQGHVDKNEGTTPHRRPRRSKAALSSKRQKQ